MIRKRNVARCVTPVASIGSINQAESPLGILPESGATHTLMEAGKIWRMAPPWTSVHGILVEGYRVASGPSRDYPYGALERQRPIFKARGLDLGDYFNGTLNIDIRPYIFRLIKPEFTFRNVEWTDLHPPEHFSFSRCKVIYRDVEYPGWVYYPHPETKFRNFQKPSLMEVIAAPIPEIKYDDELQVLVNPERIAVSESSSGKNSDAP